MLIRVQWKEVQKFSEFIDVPDDFDVSDKMAADKRLSELMADGEEFSPHSITAKVTKVKVMEEDPKTYHIVRFRFDGENEVRARGLTLEEAQAHCRREDTHGDGWFDGYEED